MVPSHPGVSPLLLAAGCCSVLLDLERLPAAALSRHRGSGAAFEEPSARDSRRLDAEEDQYANLTAVDFESLMDPAVAPGWTPLWEPPEAECGDAPEGSSCYHAVMWLLMGGFERHPDWYPGYSTESGFREVQSMLHSIGKGHCTEPCKFAAQRQQLVGGQAPGTSTSALPAPPGCHDTVEGEWCFQSLAWLKARGILLHPAWYPNLHTGSSIGEMQAELHRMGKSNCEEPCTLQGQSIQDEENSSERGNASDHEAESLEAAESVEAAPEEAPNRSEVCDDAEPLSQCYLAVKYAMSEGISTRPEAFPGLSPGATFKQVQENFYLRGRHACAKPCPIPDTKKPVDQMSEEELARYLSGEWDGMVKAAAAGSPPERAGDAPSVAAEAPAAGQNATVEAGAQPAPAGRLSEALQRSFGAAGGVAADAASREAPGAPGEAEAAPAEGANSTADPAPEGAPEAPGPAEAGPIGSGNLTAEAAPEGAPGATGAALTGDATVTVASPRSQEAPLPDVPSADQRRRSEEAAAATRTAVSPEESAARLRQQVLRQLEQAENETEDPQVMAAIKRTRAEFQAASSGALRAEGGNQKMLAESQQTGSTKMPEVIGNVTATAEAASELTEVSRDAAARRASQHVPVESGSDSDLLPYVDNDGREKTIAETRADMEQKIRHDLESQFGWQQRTTAPPEETTARLADQVLGELDQAQSTTTQKVETEEEMTARLSKQVLGELDQAQSTTTLKVETEEEMTARLSKQVLGELDQAQSTTTQKVETEEEMTARLSKQVLGELDQAQSTTTQKVETEEDMMASLRKQVLGELEAQRSQNPTSRVETLEEITDRLSKQVAAKFDAKQ